MIAAAAGLARRDPGFHRIPLAVAGLIGSAILCACSLRLGIPPGGIKAELDRTSGVAPLFIHFSVDCPEDSEAARDFHLYDYEWDFGDPGSGTWGTDGKTKNSATGPIAAHVFESPGTYRVWLTVKDGGQIVKTDWATIVVEDPDEYYKGTKTVCVSTGTDFTGAPAGADCRGGISNLSSITSLATAGKRILLRRGDSWTVTSALNWPSSAGPVTIGAFGPGAGQDALGIYGNAPEIQVSSGRFMLLDDKQDWRVMDLRIVDPSATNISFEGSYNMQRDLFLRLKLEGFENTLIWSHWNNDGRLLPIDQMAVVSCDLSGGNVEVIYIGGERLAILGNDIRNAQLSHAARVWQAYKSVISDNRISGSSVASANGRHALKLHGPGPGSGLGTPTVSSETLQHRTDFVVVSDNVFGSSGPWPVAIGPQNNVLSEEITNVVFERNRISSGFGEGAYKVEVALFAWCSHSTIRNNIFDGTGSGADYAAIAIERRGIEPAPTAVSVYNNTIYRYDNTSGTSRIGIRVGTPSSGIAVMNNLVSFPGATVKISALQDLSGKAETSGNVLTSVPGFIDPDNAQPLERDFRQAKGSPGVNQGVDVPVYEDFDGGPRPIGYYDAGAFER